ncbi:hypothetical protein PG994_007155 [Apiospora phragmitis]|uniref:Uncharacterized protein n=1 Tax=Apiospora phragmitis TaxID=2905665 RepID=A0ABR1V005_9PEZI
MFCQAGTGPVVVSFVFPDVNVDHDVMMIQQILDVFSHYDDPFERCSKLDIQQEYSGIFEIHRQVFHWVSRVPSATCIANADTGEPRPGGVCRLKHLDDPGQKGPKAKDDGQIFSWVGAQGNISPRDWMDLTRPAALSADPSPWALVYVDSDDELAAAEPDVAVPALFIARL